MSNYIFDALLNEKIEFFKSSFTKTSEIYFNEKKKLISPLEYGIHKEYACKEFLKFLIPSKYHLGEGFIINSNEQYSTQCDIVIYDSTNTPLIESGNKQRFFPMETVFAIGEVKSALSKSQLKSAINKLAKAKSLRRDNLTPGIISRKTKDKFDNYNHPFDQIFSFIICQKLTFKVSNLDFDEIYDKDILDQDRHNMILSVEDGLLLYKHKINGEEKIWPFPFSQNKKLKNRYIDKGINGKNHFLNFAEHLFTVSQLTTTFHPQFSKYTVHSEGNMLDES